MSVKIEKDGWSVSGETLEELELGIAAVQNALSARTKASSSSSVPSENRKPGRPRLHEQSERETPAQATLLSAYRFLLQLLASAEEEVIADDLARSLGLQGARGLGGFMTGVNRTIIELGFDTEDVYRNSRRPDGARIWEAGPQLEAAATAVRRAIGEERVRDARIDLSNPLVARTHDLLDPDL